MPNIKAFFLMLLLAVLQFEANVFAEDSSTAVTKLIKIETQLTIEGIGYGQGVFQKDGKVYLYGDGETGVLREFEWSEDAPLKLKETGLTVQFTRNGIDVAPHPTGLTHDPHWGTFLGDTVNQKGTIFHIDWEQMLKDGNLDNAILNMVSDDLALNGTRPEFVRIKDRSLVATSDYGSEGNELRLYDPALLQKVTRASSEGVLVHRQSCGPWVQTLEWVPELKSLALVQNQIEGLRYRLTFAAWDQALDANLGKPLDLEQPVDELEGWTYLGDRWCLYLSSSLKNNVSLGRLQLAP